MPSNLHASTPSLSVTDPTPAKASHYTEEEPDNKSASSSGSESSSSDDSSSSSSSISSARGGEASIYCSGDRTSECVYEESAGLSHILNADGAHYLFVETGKRAKATEHVDSSVIVSTAQVGSIVGQSKLSSGKRMTTRLVSRKHDAEIIESSHIFNVKSSSARFDQVGSRVVMCKRPYSITGGQDNANELMAEAEALVDRSRVRDSTKESYAGGLEWAWPEFIAFTSTDGESKGSSKSVDWGLLDVAREELVSYLVQFQMFLNRKGLTPNQLKSQWNKTYHRFATPGALINMLLVSDEVWGHSWVSAVRNSKAVDLQGFVSGMDRSSQLQLAAGFAVLWQVRKDNYKSGPWTDQATLVAALGYIAVALMFNFGWRPGQLVWTGNAAHVIRRGSLVIGLAKDGIMFRADSSYADWFQSQLLEIGLTATLRLIKEAWFVIKSSKTTGSDKKSRTQTNSLVTAKIGRETNLSTMLLEDVATVYGYMSGDANEGLAVSTGPWPSPSAVPKSFIAKGKVSKTNGGEIKSDDGAKVVLSKQTQDMIKTACKALGVVEKPFTHRSLRKHYATGMNEQARAYSDFMAKHTTGAGQWAEGSATIAKHYITSDIQGMLSLLDDDQSAEEHAARNLEEMKQRVFLNNL